jgi:hypothetical protein
MTTPDNINTDYDKLKQHIQIQVPEVDRQAKAPWISAETWKMIDTRTSKSKNRSFRPGEQQRLSRCIKRALHRDRKKRTTDAGDEIELNLKEGRIKKAWEALQRWYKHSGDRPPKPTRLDLQTVSNEYRVLYNNVQPPGNPITNTQLDTPFPVDDDVPTDDEIAAAVRSLKKRQSTGAIRYSRGTPKRTTTTIKKRERNRQRLPWMGTNLPNHKENI